MFSPTSIAHDANLAKLHEASMWNLTDNRFSSHPNTSLFKSIEVNKSNSGGNQTYQTHTTKPLIGKTPRRQELYVCFLTSHVHQVTN